MQLFCLLTYKNHGNIFRIVRQNCNNKIMSELGYIQQGKALEPNLYYLFFLLELEARLMLIFSGSPYQMIHHFMDNCIEDIYYRLRAWLDPKFATYANATFSYNIQAPVIYVHLSPDSKQGKGSTHVDQLV